MSDHDQALTPPPADGPTNAPSNPFLVVGVGASAGGLEAFQQLLAEIPENPGLCFLFVQHLEPTQRSHLPEILSRATPLPVHEVTEGMHVDVNHVYLIPPNATMIIKDGHLGIQPRSSTRGVPMPIDHLFRSLAAVQKSRAVGVLLSGGGTDGTLGFQAIKAEEGITFAQDDKTARHDSMPRSAIQDGSVDYVLPPPEIARKLLSLVQHSYTAQPELSALPGDAERRSLEEILILLRQHTGVDFVQYKRSTITRRIHRRLALRGQQTMAEYLATLHHDPAEIQSLYQDFLIRVTRFFRDEEVYQALKEQVFPHLVKDRSANNPIRIWVAGCSTGEEAYSIVISLLEYLGDCGVNCPIKLLASDVNETALERARSGKYVDNIEVDVSPERLRRFFAKVDGHYQIGKAVRDLCIFAKHDLTSDPPFSRLDLISCRNLLIYLDAALQKRVLPILHYALNPGGCLVLGSSETVGVFSQLFNIVDPKYRIYSKNVVGTTYGALDFGSYVEGAAGAARRPLGPPGLVSWNALDVQREADRVVLAKYAPVGAVVDENMTVLQFRGRTGPYLEPAPGMVSLDLLKMLRDGLVGEVRAAFNRARTENVTVQREGLPLRERDQTRLINLEVIPLKVPPSGARCFLVLFQDAPVPEPPPVSPADGAGAGTKSAMTEQEFILIQQELAATREYLQSIIEEHESACEELKSASEEILSSNEELQSTNEELQTAKEETQSANEELATLNEELQHRNVQLAQVNNDLVNLLAAVNIPIVLVSRDLRIRRFTPLAEKVLNLIPTDIGRPISDLKPNIDVPDFGALIAQVIDTLAPLETEIKDRQGRWYSLRIRPYVTLDNKIDGASIILVDIDMLRHNLEKGKT